MEIKANDERSNTLEKKPSKQPDDTPYADLVRNIRKKNGWPQRAMATALDIVQADVQRIEQGGRNTEKQFAVFLKLLPLCLNDDFPYENPIAACLDEKISTPKEGRKNAGARTEDTAKEILVAYLSRNELKTTALNPTADQVADAISDLYKAIRKKFKAR